MSSLLLLFLLIASSGSNTQTCDDETLFLLTSNGTALLLDPNLAPDRSSTIIYQSKSNTTIGQSRFHPPTETILLLVNQPNETYSIVSLNWQKKWTEKSYEISTSSNVYLSLSQRFVYLFYSRTKRLQLSPLPITSNSFEDHFLWNLPNHQRVVDYHVDEDFHFLWILFDATPFSLYMCQLQSYSCRLLVNLIEIHPPIQFLIHWSNQQFFISSRTRLLLFEYNDNQTSYALQYHNTTPSDLVQYLVLCETTDQPDLVFLNYTQAGQVCLKQCFDLPSPINGSNRVHSVQRLGKVMLTRSCSKPHRVARLVVLLLIFVDLAVLLAIIAWLTYRYLTPTNLDKSSQATSNGTLTIVEKEFVTHF